MEVFSAITFEANLNGTWTDISTDVRHKPSPRVSGIGIMSDEIDARVGDVGTLEFYLDNSTKNSGGLQGYYSPGSTNVRSGWRAGIAVRLSFSYDGYTRYKFYGYIDYDGIEVITGKYKERSVRVHASNWMKYASEWKLNLLQYQTNYRMDQAVQDIIDNMTRKPLAIQWAQGTQTFPTCFDMNKSETMATGEFQKLAMSEWGYIHMKGDDTGGETLVVESNTSRDALLAPSESSSGMLVPTKNADTTDAILLEDGTNILLEDGTNLLMDTSQFCTFTDSDIISMKVSAGRTILNRAKFTVYPRTVDSSNVILYGLDTPIQINSGDTLTDIRGKYKDPNNPNTEVTGFSMQTPVATTDYQCFVNSDGTGADLTANLTVTPIYGTSEVKYTLSLTGGTNGYVTKLNARGKGIYVYDTVEKVYEESAVSIPTYGIRNKEFDLQYLSNLSTLLTSTGKIDTGIWNGGGFLQSEALNRIEIDSIDFMVNRSSLQMFAFLFCEPGETIKISETMTTYANTDSINSYTNGNAWYINGYDFEIIDGKFVKWSPTLKRVGRP